MDRFNRLVVVVLLLLALPLCTVALAIPGEVARLIDWLGVAVAAWLGGSGSTLVDAAQRITIPGRVLLAVLAVFIDLAIGVMLFYQLRRPKTGYLVRARGSVADVSPESIQAQVMHHVSKIDGVLDLDVRVQPMTGGRVELTLDVLSVPDVLVARKVKQINKVVRQVVVRNMGLRLGAGPIIHLELASPSAMAHAAEKISHPVPLEMPARPVAALEKPSQPALPARPATEAAGNPAGESAGQSGQDLSADGDRSPVN